MRTIGTWVVEVALEVAAEVALEVVVVVVVVVVVGFEAEAEVSGSEASVQPPRTLRVG